MLSMALTPYLSSLGDVASAYVEKKQKEQGDFRILNVNSGEFFEDAPIIDAIVIWYCHIRISNHNYSILNNKCFF